jgi:hypothetical protein
MVEKWYAVQVSLPACRQAGDTTMMLEVQMPVK